MSRPFRSRSCYPPLGLCQLAAQAPDDTIIVDADAEELSDEEAFARVMALEPAMIGMTVTVATLELIALWSERFARAGVRTIAGGPQATLQPLEVLEQCPAVSAVVRGDGELVICGLVEALRRNSELDQLPGVVLRGSARLGGTGQVSNQQELEETGQVPNRQQLEETGQVPNRQQLEETGQVPNQQKVPATLRATALERHPRFEGLPLAAYGCPDARRRPMLTMATSRGCLHRCAFCASHALYGRPRFFTVPSVVDELERLVRQLGVRELSFVDDAFTLDRERTLGICQEMLRRKLELSWFCNARADELDDELVQNMAEAGCHQVYLGFESGSQRILDSVGKGLKVEQLVRAAELLARHAIARSVGFIVGLPGEDDASVAETIGLAQRVAPERLQFTRFCPLPGSKLASDTSPARFHDQGEDRIGQWIQRCYRESSHEQQRDAA